MTLAGADCPIPPYLEPHPPLFAAFPPPPHHHHHHHHQPPPTTQSLTAGSALSIGGVDGAEQRARAQRALEEKIMRALPALQEANFVSLQMKRDVRGGGVWFMS